MEIVLPVVGVVSVLAFSAWGIPKLKSVLREMRQQAIEQALLGNSDEEREEAKKWLSERESSDELEFARRLLASSDDKVVLDIAPLLAHKGRQIAEDAVEALARVACKGSERQREEAVLDLLLAPRLSPAIVKPLAKRLATEPSTAIRVNIVLLFARMAKDDAPERLDSFTKADIIRAVSGCLKDSSPEVCGCATACLEPRGPLAYLIKDAELTLMELLRSSRQEVVDGVGKLILAHRHTLRAAVSCLAASDASPQLKDSIC